jgi:hypothetical protein
MHCFKIFNFINFIIIFETITKKNEKFYIIIFLLQYKLKIKFLPLTK